MEMEIINYEVHIAYGINKKISIECYCSTILGIALQTLVTNGLVLLDGEDFTSTSMEARWLKPACAWIILAGKKKGFVQHLFSSCHNSTVCTRVILEGSVISANFLMRDAGGPFPLPLEHICRSGQVRQSGHQSAQKFPVLQITEPGENGYPILGLQQV